MPKAFGDITDRLLKLEVGHSCVVSVNRPDRDLRTARKYAPEADWSVESVEGGKVVTRVR